MENKMQTLRESLNKKGYKNYGISAFRGGEHWQKKHDSGCLFNFFIYDNEVEMVTASTTFQCSDEEQWIESQLYGLPPEIVSGEIEDIQDKLLSIYHLLDGSKFRG